MADRETAERNRWRSGWEASRDAQRRRRARLPLAEKLAWLEEAQRLVDHLDKQRRQSTP